VRFPPLPSPSPGSPRTIRWVSVAVYNPLIALMAFGVMTSDEVCFTLCSRPCTRTFWGVARLS
jgi:hypothetical protein